MSFNATSTYIQVWGQFLRANMTDHICTFHVHVRIYPISPSSWVAKKAQMGRTYRLAAISLGLWRYGLWTVLRNIKYSW